MKGREQVLLLLGSNIDPRTHVRDALSDIESRFEVVARSSLYLAPAVGAPGSPDFVNVALLIASPPEPGPLKKQLRSLETLHGRVRTDDRNQPRTLDIDIVCYASLDGLISEPVDPGLTTHHHVLIPAIDIVGNWQLPGSRRMVRDCISAIGATPEGFREVMVPLEEWSS